VTGLWCETRVVAIVDQNKENWRPPCRTDFLLAARNFHTKTACTLRCRRADWAAGVELLTTQQAVQTEPFDKLRTGKAQGERSCAKVFQKRKTGRFWRK
jgi:hypothetical protein